jgi:hypothetical protein
MGDESQRMGHLGEALYVAETPFLMLWLEFLETQALMGNPI